MPETLISPHKFYFNIVSYTSKYQDKRRITELSQVYLQQNHLTDDIDQAFGLYPNLKYIDISFNQVGAMNSNGGEISADIFLLPNLGLIGFSSNRGASMGRGLTELQYRSLNNSLARKIPHEIRMCSKLMTLNLSTNRL
ncbi:Serine/threonine-protein kinase BRI1-like 1 [Bienertia sinuspersici]